MAVVDHLVTKATLDPSDYKRGAKTVQNETDKLDRNIKKVDRSTNKFSKSLNNLVAGGAIVGFAAAVGRATIAGLEFASAIEESQAKSEVVFGSSLPRAREELRKFGRDVGRSEYELEKFAATIQDTFVPLGFARDAAASLSIETVKLATDIASFNNSADASVIKDIQSALVGNHETMRKHGVVIDQNTILQHLYAQGIERTWKELTTLEKVQARFDLIKAGTLDAAGDAARTKDSYANVQKGLGANFQRLTNAFFSPGLGEAAENVSLFSDAVGAAADGLEIANAKGIEFGLAKPGSFLGGRYHPDMDKIEEIKLRRRGIAKDLKTHEEGTIFQKGRLRYDEGALRIEDAALLKRQRELQAKIDAKIQKELDAIPQATKSVKALPGWGVGDLFGQNYLSAFGGDGDTRSTAQQSFDALPGYGAGGSWQNEAFGGEGADHSADVYSEGLKEASLGVETLASAFDDLSSRSSAAFVQMLSEGKLSFDTLGDIGKDVLKQLVAKFIELAIVNTAINAAFGLGGTSAALPTIGGKASGGPVARDKPYIVGERGAELFVPKQSGTIMNHTKMGAMGGQNIVINAPVNYIGDVDMKVDARLANQMPAIVETVIASIADR